MTVENLSRSTCVIGDLDCVVVDTPGCDEVIKAVVVLCHGFGAPGDDLVPCAPEIYRQDSKALHHVRFVFPAAPIQLEGNEFYESRAWWPIDMVKLQSMMENGEIRDLRADRPELLTARNEQIRKVLDEVTQSAGVKNDRVILGGFSQGSMLATEVALTLPHPLAGLVVWSGTLLSENEWRENARNISGVNVVQSHGKIDPILPFMGAELLKDMLIEYGAEVQFVGFNGPHTIPGTAIELAAHLIADVASR